MKIKVESISKIVFNYIMVTLVDKRIFSSCLDETRKKCVSTALGQDKTKENEDVIDSML